MLLPLCFIMADVIAIIFVMADVIANYVMWNMAPHFMLCLWQVL